MEYEKLSQVGHPVGLEVHDPVPKSFSLSVPATTSGLKNQFIIESDYVLDYGHVNTVEPGVYFIPYLLNLAKNNIGMNVSHMIDWEKVEKWMDVGGVRIEDVIAIDWNGKPVILTAAP